MGNLSLLKETGNIIERDLFERVANQKALHSCDNVSQSQSHFSTNSQSASTSWCQAHSWSFDQKFVFV
jgi:hypothetical protein